MQQVVICRRYIEGGYTEAHVAIKESENYFNQEISLPTRIPPIPFTHYFGQFTSKAGSELKITYLNENKGTTHFQIEISPIEHKQNFSHFKNEEVKLADGTEAIYVDDEKDFNYLIFEKDSFQYRFMGDDTIKKDSFLSIANSIPQ